MSFVCQEFFYPEKQYLILNVKISLVLLFQIDVCFFSIRHFRFCHLFILFFYSKNLVLTSIRSSKSRLLFYSNALQIHEMCLIFMFWIFIFSHVFIFNLFVFYFWIILHKNELYFSVLYSHHEI